MFGSRTGVVLAAAVIGLSAGLGGAILFLREPGPSSEPEQSRQQAPTLTPAVSEPPQLAAPKPEAQPAQPQRNPGLEQVDCWFAPRPDVPSRCVHLYVRENRADPKSPLRRLSAVVFESRSATKEPPLVFLVGGPGEPARIGAGELDRWATWIAEDEWLRGRDLIVLDQRGVGLSEPNMACPEMAEAGLSIFRDGTPVAETAQRWRRAGEACAARLGAQGIDMARYNTQAITADMHELLSGLAYQSWYLFGVSFGTRIALAFMRDYPDGVRGAILDSPYPPDVQAYVESAQSAASAFNAVFKQCDASPACRKAYPDLARKFESVVRRAERTPFTVVLDGPEKLTLKVDHVRLIEILFYAFYGWRDIIDVPAAIAALDAGNVQPLVKLATAALRFYEWQGASHGLFLAVTCSDEMPVNPRQAIAAEAAREPLFEAFALSNPPLSACRESGAPAAPSATERGLPTAPIPILLLSGELDPITPPKWAADIAGKLPKATLVRFAAVGHGVVSSHSCADRLIGEFLRDPTKPPFDPCLLALGAPEFSLPAASQNGPAPKAGRAR